MNKRKLVIALAALLLCFTVLISAGFAWFSLSRAPEVTGIDTRIGSNGSLEIALLSDETYMDPSKIRSSVGSSAVVQDTVDSNLAWGNVIDLSDESYGLNQISMIPARLNVAAENGSDTVGSNMLITPGYSLDGRINTFNTSTASGAYNGSGFIYAVGDGANQDYGVRGIGNISGVTPQETALVTARSLIRSYQATAVSVTKSMWQVNGGGLLEIYHHRYYSGSNSFDASDVAVLRDTAVRMLSATDYIDAALRQGVVGFVASTVSDKDTFQQARSLLLNSNIPLSTVLDNGISTGSMPSSVRQWIDRNERNQADMYAAIAACDRLEGGSYAWADISPVLDLLMDASLIYCDDYPLNTADGQLSAGASRQITVYSGAGVMADVADFSGDYNTFFEFDGVSQEVLSASTVLTPYLTQMALVLDKCSPAVQNDMNLTEIALMDVFGYAVDMAFRCNEETELLLQTAPALRVSGDSETPQTQGEGSYIRFTSEELSADRIARLMDVMRIGFLDNQSNLIAIAKPNASNYYETDTGVEAPIYLYDYSVLNDGTIYIGERLDDQSAIIPLADDTATILTIVVWLDGDYVENSMASISGKTVTGSLNLQFASSANLHPSNQTIEGG